MRRMRIGAALEEGGVRRAERGAGLEGSGDLRVGAFLLGEGSELVFADVDPREATGWRLRSSSSRTGLPVSLC